MIERGTMSETMRLAEEFYERELKSKLEPAQHGKMIAIDVESGDYALGDDSITASDALQQRHPTKRFCILRVGFPTAVKFGPRLVVPTS